MEYLPNAHWMPVENGQVCVGCACLGDQGNKRPTSCSGIPQRHAVVSGLGAGV